MCFNLETSVVTFLSGLISGIVALFYKQYILGSLILCYSLMQLSEIFIWYGIENENKELNKLGTAIGKYSLPAHNIAIGLGIYAATGEYTPLLIGIAFYLYILLVVYSRNEDISNTTEIGCKENECNKFSGKLKWPYDHSWYFHGFVISMILCFIYVKPFFPVSVFIISFFTLSALIIFLINYNNAYGSFWCWSTAISAPLLVLINTNLTNGINFVS